MMRARHHTLLYGFALGALLLLAACDPSRKSTRTFSQPKFQSSTGPGVGHGKPAVRQTWFQRHWFWQPRDRRPTRRDQ